MVEGTDVVSVRVSERGLLQEFKYLRILVFNDKILYINQQLMEYTQSCDTFPLDPTIPFVMGLFIRAFSNGINEERRSESVRNSELLS